jgi:hypothetical protein
LERKLHDAIRLAREQLARRVQESADAQRLESLGKTCGQRKKRT